MNATLQDILAATGGELVRAGAGPFLAVSTDSRTAKPGDVFVALAGEHFDGNRFAAEAVDRGATAAIVSGDAAVGAGDAAWIRVRDGLRALGDLAAARRSALCAQFVGVTGSNGKTTTKEMIAAVLAATGRKVAKSVGNENNLVGLPRTILGLDGDEDYAVLEMGMNRPGEIARLTEIARPHVGVVTNVGPAHLEGLGTLDNVAAAKAELALGLPASSTLVLNGDDPRVARMAELFSGRILLAGREGAVRAKSVAPVADGQRVEITVDGTAVVVRLRARGPHNVQNALLAAATGRALGLDAATIARGLEEFTPPPMRLQEVRLGNGARVLNDAYNANPASMEAALIALAAEPAGRRIAVLGDMWELGVEGARYHREVGAAAARARVDWLVAVGKHADDFAAGAVEAGLPEQRIARCSSANEAARVLAGSLRGDDLVLVKGSRGARMEAVIERLRGDG